MDLPLDKAQLLLERCNCTRKYIQRATIRAPRWFTYIKISIDPENGSLLTFLYNHGKELAASFIYKNLDFIAFANLINPSNELGFVK